MKKLTAALLAAAILMLSFIYSLALEGRELRIRGVDVSSFIAETDSGVVYRNFDGNALDREGFFAMLRGCGINYVRIRVWNDPYDAGGNSYGGGRCDLETAAEISSLAAESGIRSLIDFHLSDFWADPGSQQPPKSWKGLSLSDKSEAVYSYVRASLETLRERGGDVGMVQVGNEINNGLCGETGQEGIAALLKSGFRAVDDFDSSVLKAVHYTNPEKKAFSWYASKLDEYGVNYDVFSSSYYSYWHGGTQNLTAELKKIADTYGKYVTVAETAYPFTDEDSDFFGNSVSGTEDNLPYSVSVEGQTRALHDAINAVLDVGEKGLGLFYWEPAWITVGTRSYAENYKLWQRFGSGWESSYASDYAADGAKYHGGSSWDNQALFDKNGAPLSTLRVFADYGSAYDMGDVDRSGGIDIRDATLLQKHIARMLSLSAEQLSLGDMNADGMITIQDATRIQKLVAGIIIT